MTADQDIPDAILSVMVPLGSADALLIRHAELAQPMVVADPACPREHVETLEMAARAIAAGDEPEAHVGSPPEPLVGLIPRQLPGVQRQELGLPYEAPTY